MAKELSMRERLKLERYDTDEESDYGTVSDNEIDLSFDKLDLGPKKKLIVLCLGGLLVHRVHVKDKASIRGLRPDVSHGNFSGNFIDCVRNMYDYYAPDLVILMLSLCTVFKRPFCTEFLKFCFERFDVALWSSARERNIDGVLDIVTGGMRSKLQFVWGQEECTDSGYGCLHKQDKPLFLKELKDLWKIYGKYSEADTLLIDDEPHTCLINPPNTAIFPQPYKKHNPKDTLLGSDGELRKFLERLVDAKDVPSYVKDHPIGQPAITPSHHSWGYYEPIVRHFNKRDKRAESSSKAIDSDSSSSQKDDSQSSSSKLKQETCP